MSFLELFNKYYNEGNPLDKIVYKNKIINLSDETKSFSNLIDKNKDIEKYLIDIAERVYICQIKVKKRLFPWKKDTKINEEKEGKNKLIY